MEKLLNNLIVGEVLYTTNRGTNYLFIGRSSDNGVTYSINKSRKTLPFIAINKASSDFTNGKEINRDWYLNYNKHEFETRPCNLSVLKKLLSRL